MSYKSDFKRRELEHELQEEEREILEEERKMNPEDLRKKRIQEAQDEAKRQQDGW